MDRTHKIIIILLIIAIIFSVVSVVINLGALDFFTTSFKAGDKGASSNVAGVKLYVEPNPNNAGGDNG